MENDNKMGFDENPKWLKIVQILVCTWILYMAFVLVRMVTQY